MTEPTLRQQYRAAKINAETARMAYRYAKGPGPENPNYTEMRRRAELVTRLRAERLTRAGGYVSGGILVLVAFLIGGFAPSFANDDGRGWPFVVATIGVGAVIATFGWASIFRTAARRTVATAPAAPLVLPAPRHPRLVQDVVSVDTGCDARYWAAVATERGDRTILSTTELP